MTIGDSPAPPSDHPEVVRGEPWRAVALSMVLPGLGHALAGRVPAGVMWFAMTSIATIGGALLLIAADGSVLLGIVLLVAGLALSVASWWDAFRRVRDANPAEFEAQRRVEGDAWRAAALSRAIPGLGQMLERRRGPGLLLLLAWLLSDLVGKVIGPVIGSVVAGVAVWEAWLRGRGRRSNARALPLVVSTVTAASGLAGLAFQPWCREHVVRAYRVPSDSMLPTIGTGELMFADMSHAGRVEHGDIVVFPFPQDTTKTFIKRCVGVGGETIEIRDKHLFLNGRPLDEPYVVHSDNLVRPASFDYRDNFGPFRIPAGCCFLLGDNRDNSNDSRYWGPLPISMVRGRVYKVYWPLSRARSLLAGSPR